MTRVQLVAADSQETLDNNIDLATTGVTVTKPTNLADGDLMLMVSNSGGSTDLTSYPSGWTPVDAYSPPSQQNGRNQLTVAYKEVPVAADETASDYTFTFTPDANNRVAVVSLHRITGLDLDSLTDNFTAVNDDGVGASPSTVTATFPALNTANDFAFVVGVLGCHDELVPVNVPSDWLPAYTMTPGSGDRVLNVYTQTHVDSSSDTTARTVELPVAANTKRFTTTVVSFKALAPTSSPSTRLRGLMTRAQADLPTVLANPDVASAEDAAFGGYVVNVDWEDLQSGTLAYPALTASNPIDTAITQCRTWNASYGANGSDEANRIGVDRRIRVRLFCGGQDYEQSTGPVVSAAPSWVQTLAGVFNFYRSGTLYAGTPRWWEANHKLAYDDLITKLAAAYDAVPEIAEITISRCMSNFAEPMIRNLSDSGSPTTPTSISGATNYTLALDIQAQKDAILAHSVFTNTWSTLACNPYQAVGGLLGAADFDETDGGVEDEWTTGVHGLAVGDQVRFTARGGAPDDGFGPTTNFPIDTWFFVKSVPSTTTFTLSLTDGGATITGGGEGDTNASWTAETAQASTAYTEEIIDYGRTTLGDKLVLGNHSARWTDGTDVTWVTGNNLTVLEYIRDQGSPVYYQTANNTNIYDLGRTIIWLTGYGGESIELPSGYDLRHDETDRANLTNGNTVTHTSDVWTATGGVHGLSVDDRIVFTTVDTGAAAYATLTQYWVESVPTTTTFTLALTKGGAAISTTDSSGTWEAVTVTEDPYSTTADGGWDLVSYSSLVAAVGSESGFDAALTLMLALDLI